MAEQTLQRDWPRKVRMMRLFVTGSDIPETAIGVVRERGLKKMIANLNQITESMRAGANHVCNTRLCTYTITFKPLQHAR